MSRALRLIKNNIKPRYIIVLAGLLIISYSVYINVISAEFTYEANPTQSEVVNYIIIRIIIGAVYVIATIFVLKFSNKTKLIFYIIFCGLVSRIILVPSDPILEDDFNRYLWDGAVTANGHNAFKYAPKLFIEGNNENKELPEELFVLADSSNNVIKKINHPHIRTIYPSVAQIAFALTYFIAPWSTTGWKAFLLIVDIIVLLLLYRILKILKRDAKYLIIYWWNPILLHEIFNAGHMDLLLYPFIAGSIIFYLNRKYDLSSYMLAVAVGIKIWPFVLIPFILKKIWLNKVVVIKVVTISSIIIVVSFLPVLITRLDNSLGFITYTKNWTNNELLFQFVNFFVKQFILVFKINYNCSLCIARWITVIFFAGILIYLLKGKKINDFISFAFILLAVMYLISPTQFPWYYTWVLPILVLNPRLSFLLYAVFLPLYQLKYFWKFLIWVEHLPVILLFIYELTNYNARNYLHRKE